VWCFESVAFVETVQQRALDALPRRTCEFRRQALARGLLQLVERFKTERLGELVIDGGLLWRLD